MRIGGLLMEQYINEDECTDVKMCPPRRMQMCKWLAEG